MAITVFTPPSRNLVVILERREYFILENVGDRFGPANPGSRSDPWAPATRMRGRRAGRAGGARPIFKAAPTVPKMIDHMGTFTAIKYVTRLPGNPRCYVIMTSRWRPSWIFHTHIRKNVNKRCIQVCKEFKECALYPPYMPRGGSRL